MPWELQTYNCLQLQLCTLEGMSYMKLMSSSVAACFAHCLRLGGRESHSSLFMYLTDLTSSQCEIDQHLAWQWAELPDATGVLLGFTLNLSPTDPKWNKREQLMLTGSIGNGYPEAGSLQIAARLSVPLSEDLSTVLETIFAAEIGETLKRWALMHHLEQASEGSWRYSAGQHCCLILSIAARECPVTTFWR